MRFLGCAAGLILGAILAVNQVRSAESPAPGGADATLWKLMRQVDAQGAKITDLRADFVQRKFTPLLKKPLVSSGSIRIKGSVALWKTTEPSHTIMRIDAKEARLYYPEQKIVETYAVDRKMGSLAASPFPRLEVLKTYFTFERIGVKEIAPDIAEAGHLALRLRPSEPELAKHIAEVRVLLEVSSGLVLKAETIDGDGDRTVMSFSNIKTNTGLKDHDLELNLPSDVKVTHPLEGLGGAPPNREKRQ